MSRILIAGYGNPDHSDDGLDWEAGEELSETGSPEVEIITRNQLTPELADDLRDKDVIFGKQLASHFRRGSRSLLIL